MADIKLYLEQNPEIDKASYKGTELSKIESIAKLDRENLSIEIVSIEPIKGGISVLARVWDVNGTQIGFGKDGTVDMERFRIINPPIMVPDGTKRVEVNEELDFTVTVDNYKEDHQEALLQCIESIVQVKTEKFGPDKIIPGKVGSTTTTVYPDAGSGATTVDGTVRRGISFESWAAMRGGATATDSVSTTATSSTTCEIMCSSDSGSPLRALTRSIYTFDTSTIPDTDTISSATCSIYVTSRLQDTGFTNDIILVKTTPASNNNLTSSDYAIANYTGAVSAAKAHADITDNAWADFALTDTTAISKTGITKLGFINNTHDWLNAAPTWGSFARCYVLNNFADNASNDPKLVIEHAADGPSANTFHILKGKGIRIF
jgi:hypothetical protein